MKSILTALTAALALSVSLFAADTAPKALLDADDARVAATLAADKTALEKVLSANLRYAHSSGVVDTRDSFIGTLVSGKNQYLKLDYLQKDFTLLSEETAMMTGRVRVKTQSPEKGTNEFTLSFLGIWKLENGAWKFLAWQSARLPEPAPSN